MSDVLQKPVKERFVRLRTALIGAILAVVVFAGGAYLVGHEMGERDASGPSADFIHEQQADSIRRIEDTTSQLVQIEQKTAELLVGKSGAEVDTDAFEALRLQYTLAYDAVLGERGRLSRLFGPPVRAAAEQVTHQNNVALETLYLEPAELPLKTASQIHALVFNSHQARKAQWGALRKFSQAAWAEIDPET